MTSSAYIYSLTDEMILLGKSFMNRKGPAQCPVGSQMLCQQGQRLLLPIDVSLKETALTILEGCL